MERLLQDLRFGARLLWRDRGFALTALLTLAVCIGANVALFTVVDHVLLRPLGLGRYAATLLALNYVWAMVDPAHQFLHDRIARTRLVDDADAGRPANQGTSTRVAR